MFVSDSNASGEAAEEQSCVSVSFSLPVKGWNEQAARKNAQDS